MNTPKIVLSTIYIAFLFSLLSKNAGIFLVLNEGDGLNRMGKFLVRSAIVKNVKSIPQPENNQNNPITLIQKYIGINSAYAYFSPNIPEFCQLTFTSPDDKRFLLNFNQFLSSVEGRVKLGTISVFITSPELFKIHDKLFSAIAIRIFEENPNISTLTCNINTIPYALNLDAMIVEKNIQSKKLGFIVYKRNK